MLLISFIVYLVKLIYQGFIFNITLKSLFGRIISVLDYEETDVTLLNKLTVVHENDNKTSVKEFYEVDDKDTP